MFAALSYGRHFLEGATRRRHEPAGQGRHSNWPVAFWYLRRRDSSSLPLVRAAAQRHRGAAAAPPRLVSTVYQRRSRGVAATRFRFRPGDRRARRTLHGRHVRAGTVRTCKQTTRVGADGVESANRIPACQRPENLTNSSPRRRFRRRRGTDSAFQSRSNIATRTIKTRRTPLRRVYSRASRAVEASGT